MAAWKEMENAIAEVHLGPLWNNTAMTARLLFTPVFIALCCLLQSHSCKYFSSNN